MDNKSNDLSEKLKNKGYKITSQRHMVLDVIKENQGKHLSPEDIYFLVKDKTPNIGIATIYRTLALLEKIGLIYKVEFVPGNVCYEYNHADTLHKHHHLICLQCGEVTEVKEDLLESIEDAISKSHNFLIEDHSLKFYGICSKCRSNETNK